MNPFPLLTLPFVALKCAIQQIELHQVFDLTTKSHKFKHLMESVKYKNTGIYVWIEQFEENNQQIHLYSPDHSWAIKAHVPREDVTWENRLINGEVINISNTIEKNLEEEQDWFHYKTYVKMENIEPMEVLAKVGRHLLSFLKAEYYSLECTGQLDFKNFWLWKYTKKVRVLDLMGAELTPDDIEFLVGDLTIRYLDLKVDVSDGYKVQKPFKNYKQLQVMNSSWIDFNFFTIDPKCKELRIFSVLLPYPVINQIFKDWIAGKYEELEDLHFMFDEKNTLKNADEILHGLNGVPTSLNYTQLRDKNCLSLYGDQIHQDIKREVDGRLGTISIGESSLKLFVWDQQFLEEHRAKSMASIRD